MYCEASGLLNHESEVAKAETCLRIGDLTVSIHSDRAAYLSPDLKKFQAEQSVPDIRVNLHWVDRIEDAGSQNVFDSGAVWKLSRGEGDYVFDFSSQAVGNHAYKRMRTSDFTSAEVILNAELLPEDAWALEYPADELLITNYLAYYGFGVEVHGCGLLDAATGGHLFLGHSGAGKSTTTRLWRAARNPEILSDDRIILRLQNDELWMYGTPWHGEEAFASAAKTKLNRIFILQHGPTNRIAEMPPARAVGELFARCFPPFHNAQGLQNTVEFLERVIATVPCYEFQFVPDQSAVEMALNFHD